MGDFPNLPHYVRKYRQRWLVDKWGPEGGGTRRENEIKRLTYPLYQRKQKWNRWRPDPYGMQGTWGWENQYDFNRTYAHLKAVEDPWWIRTSALLGRPSGELPSEGELRQKLQWRTNMRQRGQDRYDMLRHLAVTEPDDFVRHNRHGMRYVGPDVGYYMPLDYAANKVKWAVSRAAARNVRLRKKLEVPMTNHYVDQQRLIAADIGDVPNLGNPEGIGIGHNRFDRYITSHVLGFLMPDANDLT